MLGMFRERKAVLRELLNMNIQEINEQIGCAIWYKGVSLVCWQGEASLASVEGIISCNCKTNNLEVINGSSLEQRLRFLLPADYAIDIPAGLERFAERLTLLLKKCEAKKCGTLAIPIEDMAGVEEPTPELATSIGAYLLELIETGISCETLVLASTAADGWLKIGLSRLFTQFREEPGKVNVPTQIGRAHV